MKQYQIDLTGVRPLLMHHDNIDFQEELKHWRSRPENAKSSVKGDDRSPAFSWHGCVYHDGEVLSIPSDNMRSCIMESGKKVPKTTGRGSFKVDAVSSIIIDDLFIPLLCNGRTIKWNDIESIDGDFKDHLAAVKKLGFSLLVKRAKIGSAKHVRVRPQFDKWSLSFTVTVVDDNLITEQVLSDLFTVGGRYVGLGDWRPGSPKSPGPYGQFSHQITLLGNVAM